jgi:hypothetical protein
MSKCIDLYFYTFISIILVLFYFYNKLLCKSRFVNNLTNSTSKLQTFAKFIILTKNIIACLHSSGDQTKENDMGRAGTAYGEERKGEEKCVIKGFVGEN